MTRAYLRLDPNFSDRKAHYPDGAIAAYVAILCHAEQQPQRGRFRNAKLLRVLLDKRARWLRFLIENGDLVEQNDGRLYVDGWDEWQEGDVTVPERMRRLRARKAGIVTNGVTAPVTAGVTAPSVYRPSSGGGGGSNSGGGAPYNGAASGSRKPKPGEHRGQHTDCGPCEGARSAGSIDEQMASQWAKCSTCGNRRGGVAHAPGADHEFTARS